MRIVVGSAGRKCLGAPYTSAGDRVGFHISRKNGRSALIACEAKPGRHGSNRNRGQKAGWRPSEVVRSDRDGARAFRASRGSRGVELACWTRVCDISKRQDIERMVSAAVAVLDANV